MATFKVELVVRKKGLRVEKVNQAVGMALALLRKELGDATSVSPTTRKVNENPSRADRLEEAKEAKSLAVEILESLVDEMNEWHENLPENLQNSDKASEIEECASNLETAKDDLDNADLDSIEFPSAF